MEGEPLPLYVRTTAMPLSVLDSAQVGDMRSELRELRACWDKLQEQVVDKQTRLDQAIESQAAFQDSLHNISDWLDQIESALYADVYSGDLDKNVQLMSSLRQDVQALQAEIAAAGREVYTVMADASSQSRQLVQRTLADLNERMQTVEQEAHAKEADLADTLRLWIEYQVRYKISTTIFQEDVTFYVLWV
jgi:chromosome segregation ATPase